MPSKETDGLKRAKKAAGGGSALARAVGVSPAAISQWRWVPVMQVLTVERATGIPRHVLRPDVYPPPDRSE